MSKKKDAGVKKTFPWSERSRDQRIAFVTVIVSTLNVIGFVVIGSLSVPFNMITYMVSTGTAGPPHPDNERALPNDWRGHMLLQLPWWFFAVSGLIVLIVVLVSWSPSRRFVVPGSTRYAMQRTTPAFLVFVAVLLFVIQLGDIVFYDGLLSVLSPYWVGPLLCLLAAVLAFSRWQLDSRLQHDRSEHATEMTKGSFAVAVVHGVNLVAVIFLPLFVIVASQIAYFVAHAGALPTPPQGMSLQNVTAASLWNGHMLIDVPWWFYALSAVILLGIIIYTWPISHRFEPKDNRRLVLLSTSPLFLAGSGALMIAVQTVQVLFFATPGVAGQIYLPGFALCIAAVALALVLWRWGPGSKAIREAYSKPHRGRKVSPRV